jgi:hypothetical protein
MVSICPHNRGNPVCVDDPCYRCGGKWKIMRLVQDEVEAVASWGDFVVKCRGCGIVSMATRQAAAARSSAS